MTSTGAVAGVAFLAYLEHPLAPRPRPGQIVVLDRLGGAPQTGGAGGDRSAGVRVGAVAWVRPGLQPQRVGFQQDRGVRESCGGEDEGERWTLRSRLRWGRCRWGMWWVGLSMPESRITHCENRCMDPGTGGCSRSPQQPLLKASAPEHEARSVPLGVWTRGECPVLELRTGFRPSRTRWCPFSGRRAPRGPAPLAPGWVAATGRWRQPDRG